MTGFLCLCSSHYAFYLICIIVLYVVFEKNIFSLFTLLIKGLVFQVKVLMSLPVHQLFLLLGNNKVNLFWAANIPPSEMLCPSSDSEERQRFVTAKYCQGKYRRYHALFGQQEALNKVRHSDFL